MAVVTVPQTAEDIEKILCKRLGVTIKQFRQVFAVEQKATDDFLIQQRKEWINKETWILVNDIVRGQKGTWDSQTKQWTIPYGTDSEATYKQVRNETPTQTKETSQVKTGYYERFPVNSVISPNFALRLNIGDDIQELVNQIEASKAGNESQVIAEPLICRPAKTFGCVEVGGGERRLLAAKKMGLTAVPIIVKDFSDEEFDRIRLMENLARKDMTDYEVARAIKHLMDKYPDVYSTQESIAEIFGKTQAWVSYHLRMLELNEDKNITRVINPEQFTEGQARALLEAPEEKRPEVARHIAEHLKTEGKLPSMQKIKSFVHPEVEEFAIPEEPEEPEEQLTIEEPKESQKQEPPKEPETPSLTQPVPPLVPIEKIDTGLIFTCPECGWTATHIHIKPSGNHKLQEVTEF